MEKYTDEDLRDYLLEQMSDEKTRAFNEALVTDAELQKRTDEFRDIIMIATLSSQERTRALITELKEKEAGRKKWRLWGGLLLIALLVAGALYLGGVIGPSSSEIPPPESTETGKELIDNEEPQRTLPIDGALERQEEGEEDDQIQDPIDQPEVQPENEAEDVIRNNRKEEPKESGEKQPEVEKETPGSPVYAALITDAAVDMYKLPVGLAPDRDRDAKDTLSIAYAALQTGEAESAILLLENYQGDGSKNVSTLVQCYLGHAYFLKGNFEESVTNFNRSIAGLDESSPLDPDQLEWNLLLALLARDNEQGTQAQELIRKMSDPEEYHNFAVPVSKLLERIGEGEE